MLPSRPGTSILMDGRSEGSVAIDNYARHWPGKNIHSQCRRMSFGQYHTMTAEGWCDIGQPIASDMLPNVVLIEIFDLYADEDMGEDVKSFKKQRIEEWITLAQGCRRWRSAVFQSPHRLNLRLICTPKTPARDIMNIWPPLPLIIQDYYGIFDGEHTVNHRVRIT